MISGNTLRLLSPELLLLFTGLVVLCADFIWRDQVRKTLWIPALAVVGLAAALAAAILLWKTDQTTVLAVMAVDHFALLFKIIATLTVGLVVVASVPYLQARTPYRGEFYALLVFAALAICLASSAINLISVYLAMEFLSITSYVLAGYLRGDKKSNEAGLKYFLYGAVTSAAMLYGMSLLYGATGTTDLAGIAQTFTASAPDMQWLAVAAIILLLAGFSFKMVLAPFHQWAPDTYEGAPTPVTAFLSVGSKAAGFAILMRVFLTALYDFQGGIGWSALMSLSIISMLLGNLIALRQTDIKRMLAYSSIAQAGYIIIGVIAMATDATNSFQGINGTLFYLLGYLFSNLAAFIAVIAFENATDSTAIADYKGLVRRSPVLAGVLLIAMLSLAGIPGTAGFLGKFLVFGAAIQVGEWRTLILAIVGIIASVIGAFYYLNVVRQIFFEPADEGAAPIAVPAGLKVGLALAAVGILLIGVYPQPFINLATQSMQMLAAAF
ncbi:MAG: NADH-quinone oxidoreductase subunit N [Anaerolineae bacterium]|nr:NADH-quinone oxidoreductase subunit N [Anaerolineae bacterium]